MTIYLVDPETNSKVSIRELRDGIKIVQKWKRNRRVESMAYNFKLQDVLDHYNDLGFKEFKI